MTIENVLASLAVRDLPAAINWYEKLLEQKVDSQPMPEVAEWKFKGGGWLQVYENIERAGKGSVTFSASDISQQHAHCKQLDIDMRDEHDTGNVKVFMIKDPDGNSIAFAEAKDPSMAH